MRLPTLVYERGGRTQSQSAQDKAKPRKCPLCKKWLGSWRERADHLVEQHGWRVRCER